jgi:TatD DNase family protein
MFIDSHCHLDFPDLIADLPAVLATMRANRVLKALCVSVNLADFPNVLQLAVEHDELYASVGVHPDYEDVEEPTVDGLCKLAGHPKVIAIGETGLDYYRLTGDLSWQRERFRTHIQAAKIARKPLIIHTRSASEDTIRLMQEENAAAVGGVMHCFTESWEVARSALDLGFYISLSGIVTFRNAESLREVARKVPADRLLIETDSPYLAPVPYRGKSNEPAYVVKTLHQLAETKGVSFEAMAQTTNDNFFRLFSKIPRPERYR